MTLHYIMFDSGSGAELARGMCPEGYLNEVISGLPVHTDLVIVPGDAVAQVNTDLTAVHAFCCAQVDAEADRACALLVTPGETQDFRYRKKLAEAERWTKDSDPAAFPFLRAEAAATAVPIAQLAARVVAASAASDEPVARIEARRIATKQRIRAAGANLAVVKMAMNVDWNGLAQGDI